MSRLWAFGCSETFGMVLPDTQNSQDESIDLTNTPPSKYAWPQLLANKMGLECMNKGICSNSNKGIVQSIIAAMGQIEPDDIICIQWTHYLRTNVYLDSGELLRVNSFARGPNWEDLNAGNPTEPRAIVNKAYENFLLQIDFDRTCSEDTLLYMDYVNLLLPNIIYNFAIAGAPGFHEDYKYTHIIKSRILSDNSIGSNFPRAPDGLHTGVEGHAAIAEHYYNVIKEQ